MIRHNNMSNSSNTIDWPFFSMDNDTHPHGYHYTSFDFRCKDIGKFKQIIEELYNNHHANLSNYLFENDSEFTNVCFMKHCGNGDMHIETPILAAIYSNNFQAVQLLIDYDPTLINSGTHIRSILSTAICLKHYDIANYLLDMGADPEIQGKRGTTAISTAISNSYVPLVKRMLKMDIDFQHIMGNFYKENYLDRCIQRCNINDQHQIIIGKLLMNKGIDVDFDSLDEDKKLIYNKMVMCKHT